MSRNSSDDENSRSDLSDDDLDNTNSEDEEGYDLLSCSESGTEEKENTLVTIIPTNLR